MVDASAGLASLLGAKGWVTGDDARPFCRDWLNRYGESPSFRKAATPASAAAPWPTSPAPSSCPSRE